MAEITKPQNYTTFPSVAYQQAYTSLQEPSGPGYSGSGVAVNVDTALGLAAAWEAVTQISGHIAGLPLNIMRRQAQAVRSPPRTLCKNSSMNGPTIGKPRLRFANC